MRTNKGEGSREGRMSRIEGNEVSLPFFFFLVFLASVDGRKGNFEFESRVVGKKG